MRRIDYLSRLCAAGLAWSDWYDQAHRDLRSVALQRGWPWRDYANVLAIVSPRVQVTRSVRLAHHYLEHGIPAKSTLGITAMRLRHYRETGEIRGTKCVAFARALKGDRSSVVLDVWMARALAIPESWLDVRDDRPRNVAVVASAVAKVTQLGSRYDLSPRDTQAAIWSGQLLRSGRNPVRLRLKEMQR